LAHLWLPAGADPSFGIPGRTVEVVVISRNQLKFIAREAGSVLNVEIREVEWEALSRKCAVGAGF
jgi:hypothetical protein